MVIHNHKLILFALDSSIKMEHAKQSAKFKAANDIKFQLVIHKFDERLIKAHNFSFTASNTWRLSVTFHERKMCMQLKFFGEYFEFSLPQFKEFLLFPCATHKNRIFIVDFVQHNTLIASWKCFYNSILLGILVVLSSALAYASFGFAVPTFNVSNLVGQRTVTLHEPSWTWKRDLNPKAQQMKNWGKQMVKVGTRSGRTSTEPSVDEIKFMFFVYWTWKYIIKTRTTPFNPTRNWCEIKVDFFLISPIRWSTLPHENISPSTFESTKIRITPNTTTIFILLQQTNFIEQFFSSISISMTHIWEDMSP